MPLDAFAPLRTDKALAMLEQALSDLDAAYTVDDLRQILRAVILAQLSTLPGPDDFTA